MTSGPLRELTALANLWTTDSTWWIFSAVSCTALVCLLLRAIALGRRLARAEGATARSDVALGLVLFAAALALRLLLPERVPYTFNDEYEYVDYAQRLLVTGAYRLWTGPPAGVYLYALAFAVGGASLPVAFATTIVVASLTPLALCWSLRVLRVERSVALLAAALLVLAPLHVKHAASASLEIASLLFLLLAIGTFVEALRRPGLLAALCFATSFFFALTVRVENWTLLVLLPLLAWLWRAELRRPPIAHLALAALAIVLAAAYLPGILGAPIRYDPWWKSRLPVPALLATNLGFWVGGDALQRKLPLLVGAVGLVAGTRRAPRATVFWVAFVALLSVVFVLYGLNVGWREEPHQPPPWGARAAGHDMFRFNVILLPAVAFVLASGLVALARGGAALLRGTGVVRSWSPATRVGAVAAACVLLVTLLLWRGESLSYHPLAFIASPYNRGFEIAEYRFVRDALAGGRRGTLYVLPPAAGIVLGEVAVRPLDALEDDLHAGAGTPAFLYVNARQLAVPALQRDLVGLQQRHVLEEVARRVEGRDVFMLFAVRPRLPPSGAAGTS